MDLKQLKEFILEHKRCSLSSVDILINPDIILFLINKIEEIWKDIPGHLSHQVSNYGNIKNKTNEQILNPTPNADGYLQVRLHDSTYRVHRLVLLAFSGPSNLEVNHIDGNKLNNKLKNLEYCTRSYNVKHSFKMGLNSNRGENNKFAKLTEVKVKEIKKMLKIKTATEIAKIYNVDRTTITAIKLGKNWSHVN